MSDNRQAEVLATHICNNNFAGVMRMLGAGTNPNYKDGYLGALCVTYGHRKCFHALLMYEFDLKAHGQQLWDLQQQLQTSKTFGKFLAEKMDELEIAAGEQLFKRF